VTDEPTPVRDLLREAARRLAEGGVASPEYDAAELLAHVLGTTRGRLPLAEPVEPRPRDRYDELVTRRATREPLQHLIGTAAFRHVEVMVGPGVFVPRPETELVAQLAIDALLAVPGGAPRAADLGTGSGAIALALATEVPHAEVIAVENSPRAFVWAREDARRVGALNLRLVFADLADALPELDGRLDVVVSNPPYIPPDAVPVDVEVREHDPDIALYGGGPDGLAVPRAVVATAARLLRPGGVFVMEHAEVQAAAVREIVRAAGLVQVSTGTDLTGRDRYVSARRP
jgi:release factor glutamine methyltransferase